MGVPIKPGTEGWDRHTPGHSSHPAGRLVMPGCCLSIQGEPQLVPSRVWCNPVPAAPPGQPRGMLRWHRCWTRWTRHRWKAPCPAAPRHPAAPRAAPRPGESIPGPPGETPGSRMISTTGSRRSRMRCSRRATAFLSLKTDFLERFGRIPLGTDSPFGGDTQVHRLEERGLSPKVQWPQAPACPCAMLHPLCTRSHSAGCHFPQTQRGDTQLLNSTEYGTRYARHNHLGGHREAGLGRIWAKFFAWEGRGLPVLFGTRSGLGK